MRSRLPSLGHVRGAPPQALLRHLPLLARDGGEPAVSDTLTARATTFGFRAAWRLVRRLPATFAYRLFDAAALVVARRGGGDVAQMRATYARVRPELDGPALDALVEAGVRSYFRYWCEAFRLPDRSPSDIRAGVRAVDDTAVRAELAAGRPVVLFLGHLGNWDTAGAWAGLELGPVTTVAERLEPEDLFQEFLAFRECLGMTILPLTGGDDPFRALLAAAREPRVIPLLADRDLTRGGVEVDFCGHRARMAVGPAALAVSTGAALFPVSLRYERVSARAVPGGHRLVITFHDRVPAPSQGRTRERTLAMTQGCADALAGAVRAHTQDWHMMQPVFVEDLRPEHRHR